MSDDLPTIKVTALVDAVVNSLSDGQAGSRADLHLAILHHSVMEIVRAGDESPAGPNPIKAKVSEALLGILDAVFPL